MASARILLITLFASISKIEQVYSSAHPGNPLSFSYPFYSLSYLPPSHLIKDYSTNVKIVELASIHNIPQNGLYQIYELLWNRLSTSPSIIIEDMLEKLATSISRERNYLQSATSNLSVNSQVRNPKMERYLPDDLKEAYGSMLKYFDTQIPQLSPDTKSAIENLVRSYVPPISLQDAGDLIYELQTCIRYMLAHEDLF